MNNEFYDQSYQTNPGNGYAKRAKIILIASVVTTVLVVIIGFVWFGKNKSSQPIHTSLTNGITSSGQRIGTLQVSYKDLPDMNNLTVSLNQKILTGNGINQDPLAPGSYTLTVAKPSYITFSTPFLIVAGQTTTVSVDLKPNVNPALTSWSQIEAVPGDPDENDGGQTEGSHLQANILQIVYFYNKTWAFLISDDGGTTTYSVVQFQFDEHDWDVIAGPVPGDFVDSELSDIPSQITDYLQNNNYVESGD